MLWPSPSPDIKTPLNDVSNIDKTIDHMTYALPSVLFDLVERQRNGGDAVRYVSAGDISAFTDAVERLIYDLELRLAMTLRARKRIAASLDWRPQAKAYVGVYEDLTGIRREAEPEVAGVLRTSEADEWGSTHILVSDKPNWPNATSTERPE